MFWRGEIIFIVVDWILVWKRVKYVWTATTVFTIYKPYFIDICRRSDNVNMSTYLCEPSVDEQCHWGAFSFFASLILSKLTYNYYGHKNEVRKTRVLFAAKNIFKGKMTEVIFTFYDIQKLGWRTFKIPDY